MRQGATVVLFGGRDAVQNFGELWVWTRASGRWHQPLIVGVPPSPRFGHCVAPLAVPGVDGTMMGADGAGRKLVIFGGCAVNVIDAHAAHGRGAAAGGETHPRERGARARERGAREGGWVRTTTPNDDGGGGGAVCLR